MSNIVTNDLVGFKNMKIIQNKEYFNFSLDSVLLPNFIHFSKNTKRILDLCTGNAPIPLIMSTKTDAKIIGVELQKEIYDLAVESVRINNLSDQIEIINDDVNNIYDTFDSDSFDIVTCNPPYFKINAESLRNKNEIKTIARHEVHVNIEQILKIARKLLKNNGSLYIVHRSERIFEITNLMSKYNLEPKRVKLIYPKSNSDSNIFIIEARKNGKPGVKIEKPLIAHNNDGSYSEETLNCFK